MSSLGAVGPTLEKQYSKGVHDNRFNLHEFAGDPRHEKLVCLARSVAAVMRDSELIELGGSTAILRYSTWKLKDDLAAPSNDGNFGPASATLRFKDEPVAAFGTAFLVGPRLIASAKHVFEGEDLSRLRIVFDYFMENKYGRNLFLSVYRIKEIKASDDRDDSNKPDWALVELTEEVVGRVPLPVETNPGRVFPGNQIYIIGHPSGLPTKVTLGGEIKEVKSSEKYFSVAVDTFAGNSGSPLFDAATDKVIGIHTTTFQSLKKKGIKDADYIKNSAGEMEVRRITPEDIRHTIHYESLGTRYTTVVWFYEGAQKMAMLVDLINAFNQGADEKEVAKLVARAKQKSLAQRDAARTLQHHSNSCVRSSGLGSESSLNSSKPISGSACVLL